MQSAPARVSSKERKMRLAKAGLIRCVICPVNHGENAKRQPKSDVGKNPRRR